MLGIGVSVCRPGRPLAAAAYSASWTHLVATGSTTDTTSYVSDSFTPTAGSVVAGFVLATASVAAAPTLTASANGLTFTLIASALKNTSADRLYFFIANQATPSSPSAMTLTFATSDSATACVIGVGEAIGLAAAGSSAVVQSATATDVASGSAAETTFGQACVTSNIKLFGMASTVGTARTAPTGMTKVGETLISTPTGGMFYAYRNSGFTGTVLTSGSSTNGSCCAVAVELH